MKAYTTLLIGWVVLFIIFVIGNGYLQGRFKTEIFVSYVGTDFYKTINSIEFAKLNVKQDIDFSIQKTKQDLKILMIDENNQKLFLDKFKSNFHPSHQFSDEDVSIVIDSIDLTDSKLKVDATIISTSEYKKAESKVQFINPVE